jgi:hypothetical protein
VEFESPHPLPQALRLLATIQMVTEDGPHTLAEVGAITARWERRRSCRPCHPRAISSGRQRYPADNHGQWDKAAELAARPLTWEPEAARNCMACKGS